MVLHKQKNKQYELLLDCLQKDWKYCQYCSIYFMKNTLCATSLILFYNRTKSGQKFNWVWFKLILHLCSIGVFNGKFSLSLKIFAVLFPNQSSNFKSEMQNCSKFWAGHQKHLQPHRSLQRESFILCALKNWYSPEINLFRLNRIIFSALGFVSNVSVTWNETQHHWLHPLTWKYIFLPAFA